MEKVKTVLPPNIAAIVAARVYDIRKSTLFKEEFGQNFDSNFKITIWFTLFNASLSC